MTIHRYGPGNPQGVEMSVQNGKDNAIVLRFWAMAGAGTEDVLEYTIPPEEMLDFMRRVTQEVGIALDAVGLAMAYGDCPTCRNARLVDGQERGGRVEKINCPDCRGGGIPVAFRHYPIHGGGLAPRGGDA